MNLRRIVGRSIAEAVSVANLLASPRSGLRILMYHAVGSDALGDQLGIYSISPDMFRRHMDCLVEHYAGQVVPLTPETTIKDKLEIAITFDDGYLDNLRVAAPILAERGLPFTVFVSSELVREGLPNFLTPAELRELSDYPGVTIGAHGATHVPLADCDDDCLRQELESSKAWLEDITGHEVNTMAYPHGSTNRRVRYATADAGYNLAASSYPNINGRDRDRLLLGRTAIFGGDSMRIFRQKLNGHWDWYRFIGVDPARS